ncbi:hypothetical protein 162322314 [Organic Lake phycodnavirus 1]|nr:hypothetical protein 162322314 [Organic Lake phycodnavirus 1]
MIHFSISKDNSIYRLYDITKENIRTQITYKTPFYFDGSTILNTSEHPPKTIQHKIYESIDILEPNVKFFPSHNIYPFQKYMKLHRNLECRNFYKITHGSCRAICIHPKYKSLFKHKKNVFEYNKKIHHYIRENSLFIHVSFKKDDVLCLPNFWLLVLYSKTPCVVEKIQYSTILNGPALLLG